MIWFEFIYKTCTQKKQKAKGEEYLKGEIQYYMCVEVDPQTNYVVKKLHSRKQFFEISMEWPQIFLRSY